MKKLLKRWVPLFMALALVVGAVNNNYLTAQATGSDTQIGGGYGGKR